MSLASSPDCLFRPEEHAFKTLFPSVEDSTYVFDDYLKGDVYDHTDQDSNKELSEALTDYLERKQSITSCSGFSPSVSTGRNQPSSPQPWRKGLWCMNQNVTTAPDIATTKTRSNPQQRRTSQKVKYDSTGKDAYLNPRSPPATPLKGTKNFMTSLKTTNLDQSLHAQQQKFSRELTLSPSPMYAQLQYQNRMVHRDSWQQDFQNFNLIPKDGSQSPPISGNSITQQQIHVSNLNAGIAARNRAAVQQHSHPNMYTVSQQSQMAGNVYTIVDPALLSPSQIGQAITTQGDEAVYTSLYQAQSNHGLPTWTTESSETSGASHYSYASLRGLENAGLIQERYPSQSPALSTNHMGVRQQYLQQYHYPLMAQPTPQRTTHQLLRRPATHTEGLGIHFLPSAALSPSTPNSTATNLMHAYPPLPPPRTYAFTDDPLNTPRQTGRQVSQLRSPSPCISPTNTSRTLRQRSPTHSNSTTRTRRKSVGNSGPIRDMALPPMPKTPKTPRTPAGHGLIDFVNFTPKDSAKLLSDVAPSGSAKTRARREAEAKDKSKRLSEAVRRAGGDLRVLKAEGLCLS